MAEHRPVPPTRLLKTDVDLFARKSWLEHYRRKARLVLESYGLSATAIWITPSRSKGYHVRIYLDKPVSARFANMLQWLLLDHCSRVSFNDARIAVGFDEWNKLFEDPRR